MSDTFLIIAIGVIGIGIGFAVGLLVNSLRKPQRDIDQQELPKTSSMTKPNLRQQSSIQGPAQVTIDRADQVLHPQDQVSVKRPSMNPVEVFTRALQPQVQPKHPFTRSIAEQVDEILQEMLETSPLHSKAIRLLELPQRGMVVMIGLDQYQGVDAVPDEEVRSIIRAAVAEWERRVSEDSIVET